MPVCRSSRWVVLGLLVAAGTAGAAPLRTHEAHAQLRDAPAQLRDALVGADGALLVAAYDRGEVLKLDPATGAVVAKCPVGRGPVALAQSPDGAVVACISNLAATVTLIRPTDMGILATIECAKGPTAVTPLPDGRFAVVSGFSDTVTIVDPAEPGRLSTLEDVGSVPVDAAAAGALLAVVTRVPQAMVLVATDTLEVVATIALGAAPAAAAALDDGRFAVALASGIVVVDPQTRKVTAQASAVARDLFASGGRLLALEEDAVEVFTSNLERVERIALPGPGVALTAASDFIVVLSPRTRAWYACGKPPEFEPPATVVAEPVEPESPPKTGLVVVEAEPIDAPQAQPEPQPAPPEPVGGPEAPSAESQPEEARLEPLGKAEPAPNAVPEVSATGDRAAPEALPSEEVDAAEKEPTPTKYRPTPFVSPYARAPRAPRRRPAPSPIEGVSQLSLNEALEQRITSKPEDQIREVDWTQPLRDIQADQMQHEFGKDEILFEGNVRLRLDTVSFAADRFWASDSAGEMRAEGNVIVAQDPSILTADEVYYRVPDESEMPQALVLGPHMDEQERAKLRLSSGTLQARNVLMSQPTQAFFAERLEYNLLERTGEIEGARGRVDIYFFSADKLHIRGPGSVDAENAWVTTCDIDNPDYRILLNKFSIRDGKIVYATGARLQLGKFKTPLYWPRWGYKPTRVGAPIRIDIDSGHRAEIGYYVNVGQQFRLSSDAVLGLRFFPTTHEGVGFGIESEYDFTDNPASPLFRGKGEFRTLYTTKERGHAELYHRHQMRDDTVALLQWEQWFDRDFYKDFYYEDYRDRTSPRTFVNVTHTKPTQIATATVRASTHDFVRETERLPEVTYHLLHRQVAPRLYLSFDTIDGYVEREPWGRHAVRLVNVGRLTYDIDFHEALSLTPFVEVDATWYSEERNAESSDFRLANTIGATLQTRLHKKYPGAFGFSGFKHVVLPSITLSYRPEPTMGVEETPRFDAYDVSYGRSRLETKLDNVVFGRDAETEEVWQVARLSLYQGNDFWNEIRKAQDYEAEFDLRPRPWWGWLLAAEHHRISDDFDFNEPFLLERLAFEWYERVFGEPYDRDLIWQYDLKYGHYTRLLTYLYYDDAAFDGRFNAHLGYAYTKTQGRVFNREVLYGSGYELTDNWAVAFEHRYDFERDELAQQKYELRRNLECWSAAVTFRDRQQGWDVGFEVNIIGIPGGKVKL